MNHPRALSAAQRALGFTVERRGENAVIQYPDSARVASAEEVRMWDALGEKRPMPIAADASVDAPPAATAKAPPAPPVKPPREERASPPAKSEGRPLRRW